MHSLIIGQTESGKSCLAKLLARQLHDSGKTVAVLDPLCDPGWKAKFQTDDIEEMREFLEKNRSVYLFVDECGEWFNEGNDTTHAWLATRSRHYGHSVFFISQRAVQIPTTMRGQASRLYLFTSSAYDGKIHAEEWNKPELLTCNSLPQFHFYRVSRFDVLEKLRIKDFSSVAKWSNIPDSNARKPSTRSGNARKMDKGKGEE